MIARPSWGESLPSSRTLVVWQVTLGLALAATFFIDAWWVQSVAEAGERTVLLARGMLAGLLIMAATLFVAGRVTDIAERGEDEAKAALATVRAVLDGLPVAAFVVGHHGRPLYVNRRASELLGRGVEDVGIIELPDAYAAYLAGTDEPYPAERMPILRALLGEENATADDMEIDHGGKRVPLRIWASPVRGDDGRVLMAIAGFVERD